jgi:hypothetical protein
MQSSTADQSQASSRRMKNKFRKHIGSLIRLNKNSIHPNLGRTLLAQLSVVPPGLG